MNPTRTPVNLITGFLGTGKTSTILKLLEQKPVDEIWGVIVNEFGDIGIDGAVLGDRDGMDVREIAGGCLCCVTGPQLTTTVVRLIRERRPARLLIEASGLAHASNLVDDLRRAPLGDALDVQATLTLVDPRQFVVLNYRNHPIYGDQVACADVLVATKCDLADDGVMTRFRAQTADLFPPKTAVVQADHGAIDLSLLDLPARPAGRYRARRDTPDSGFVTSGVTWPADVVFDADRLCAVFDRITGQVPGLVRAKAVMNLGRDYAWFNWVEGVWGAQTVAWRRESRFELIAPQDAPDTLTDALAACIIAAA